MRRRAFRATGSRRQAKELTHRALMQAALKLLSKNSFDSISLREVTRAAGVSPTAFYRHFDNMEELGLELVDESFGSLHAMLREARADPTLYANAIPRSLEIVGRHVAEHPDHVRFIARERNGGIRRLRQAIRRELRLFADELAIDLAGFPNLRDWRTEDRRMMAGLIAETVVHTSTELLDARGKAADELVQEATKQLRLIALGASLWNKRDSTRSR